MTDGEKEEAAIQAYVKACSGLIQSALSSARREDAAGVEGLGRLLQLGGLLQLSSTYSPTTRMCLLRVEVIDLDGEAHRLMRCELQAKDHRWGG